MTELPKLFIVYSRKDTEYKELLLNNLKIIQKNSFNIWHDQDIKPGEEWDEKIKYNLKNADIVLLLISSDALNSDYIKNYEIKEAFEKHIEQQSTLIPVVLRFCLWQDFPIENLKGTVHKKLGDLQAITFNNLPLSHTSHDKDEAFTNASAKIKEVVAIFKNKKSEDEIAIEVEVWNRAKIKDNLIAYKGYIDNYPNGKFVFEALERISTLEREDEYWTVTIKINSISSYQKYIIKFPTGKYLYQANQNIDSINKINKEVRIDTMLKELIQLPVIWKKTFKLNAHLKTHYNERGYNWDYWLNKNTTMGTDVSDHYNPELLSLEISRQEVEAIMNIEKIVLIPYSTNDEWQIYDNLIPLKLFPALETLDFTLSKVNSLEGVESLRTLKRIFANWITIKDFDYNFLTPLTQVEVFHYCIRDTSNNLEFISNFKNLKELILRGADFNIPKKLSHGGLNFVKGFRRLETLHLNAIEVDDYAFLENLTELKELSIENSYFSNLQFIEKCIKLTKLQISTPVPYYGDNKVSVELKNVSIVSKLYNLTFLQIDRYIINDELIFSDNSQVKELFVWDTIFKSISFLPRLSNLEAVYFGQNSVNNPLPYLSNLKKLNKIYVGSIVAKSEIENFINSRTNFFVIEQYDNETKSWIKYTK